MEKRLYLDEDYLGFLKKSKEQRGEQQGGKYAVRVQEGVLADGKPNYKYMSNDEYAEWLKKKGKSEGDGKKEESSEARLKGKLEKEQETSSKHAGAASAGKVTRRSSGRASVLDRKDSSNAAGAKRGKNVKKSIPLYLGEK
jgi:hypothetical protein